MPPPDGLNRTLGELRSADARCTGTVLPHYGVSADLLHTDPAAHTLMLDDDRAEQTVTLLRTLGYLSNPPAAAPGATGAAGKPTGEWTWTRAAIEAGWRQFSTDWRVSQRAQPPTVRVDTGLPFTAGSDSGATADREALRRILKACATLEGECTVNAWPTAPTADLASRIVLARLHLFGVHHGPVDQPLPPALDATVQARARGILDDRGVTLSSLDVTNRLGDLAALTTALGRRLRDRLIVLDLPADEPLDPAATRYDRAAFGPGRTFRVLNLEHPTSRAWCDLAVRVLQIRLWTLDYYEGEIDGRWGRLCREAYDAFRRDFRILTTNDYRARILPDGRLVLDAAAVLDYLAAEVDTPAADTERHQIDHLLQDPQLQAQPAVWAQLAAQADRNDGRPVASLGTAGLSLHSPANLRRQRYFGWRGIFASFGRLLHDAWDNVTKFAHRIASAVASGARWLKSIVRYAIDATRAGMRVAGLALRRLGHWATGTPVVTGDYPAIVFTHWQMDFDTITFRDRRCDPATLAQHTRTLAWMARSFSLLVRMAQPLVRLILTLGNWLLFAWQAVQLIREVVAAAQDPLFDELLADHAAT